MTRFRGACSVEVLIRAALAFTGISCAAGAALPAGLVCLISSKSEKVPASRRRLLDAKTFAEISNGWEGAQLVDGLKHWFAPSSKIAFEWTSWNKSSLMAIPIPGAGDTPDGYLLRLTCRHDTRYYTAMEKLGVKWQCGRLAVPDGDHNEASWSHFLHGAYSILIQ